MKTFGTAALVIAALASAGCAGLLGLDDKEFESTEGAGASTSSGGSGGGTGGTGGTSSTGTTGTTATGGSGGSGGAGGGPPNPLEELFDFTATGDEAADALAERGWLFTWRPPTKEAYPEFGPPDVFPYPGMGVVDDQLVFGITKTSYWVNERKGLLMYKKITGDFLIVTDVMVKDHAEPTPGVPTDEQAGAGIMARDPGSSAFESGGQNWISIDRSGMLGAPKVHGSWGRGDTSGSIGTDAAQGGKIALCRLGSQFFVFFKDGAKPWEQKDELLATLPADFLLPDELQVGLFLYAYNVDVASGMDNPSPHGVKGAFQYVKHIDPAGTCDPVANGE